MSNEMKTLYITAFPYAIQNGTLEVPADLDSDYYSEYVEEHWDDICFSTPDLDYAGTDFEIDE